MSQYRLFIDIPLGTNEEEAVAKTYTLIGKYTNDVQTRLMESMGIEQFNYRLGYDDDRQRSNYLDKNENDHVSNKKTRIEIG
tara:strand:- start:16 stop:261 length:246 start_codon:yes stop_codon:yes gene_type:complete